MKRSASVLVSCLVVTYVALCLFFYASQDRIMYQVRSDKPVPAQWGAEGAKIVSVVTSDGILLEGWYFPLTSPNRDVIVYFHGNGQHVGTTFRNRMQRFVESGYGLLMAEYRGYSGFSGKPDEKGFYKDARAFVDWITKDQKIDQSRLVFVGESMGSSLALQMALEYNRAKALILLSSFSSSVDYAKLHYPYFPVALIIKDRFPNYEKIRTVKVPVFFAHGKQDNIVSFVQSEKLFTFATSKKRLKLYDDGNHVNLFDLGVVIQIQNFLDSLEE